MEVSFRDDLRLRDDRRDYAGSDMRGLLLQVVVDRQPTCVLHGIVSERALIALLGHDDEWVTAQVARCAAEAFRRELEFGNLIPTPADQPWIDCSAYTARDFYDLTMPEAGAVVLRFELTKAAYRVE